MTTPRNSGKPWTTKDERELTDYARSNTPTRLIAHKMGRSEDAVRNRASDMGLSLKPTNQSPYGPRKK